MFISRWGLFTHGAVDGYSRLFLFLECRNNYRAETVLQFFVEACHRYGLPSRYRTDHGGENQQVALFMNLVRGSDRGSHLAGKSTSNQRIERLWRDVRHQVISVFQNLFAQMEMDGILNIEQPRHMVALHLVFLPEINRRLRSFRLAWNKHAIRTEGSKTPEQLWLDGMLANANSAHTATEYVFGEVEASVEVSLVASLAKFNVTVEQIGLPQENDQNEVEATPLHPAGLEDVLNSDLSLVKKFQDVLAMLWL